VRISNISDRPNVAHEAQAVRIGGQMLRPGKAMDVVDAVVTSKLRALHGKLLWFGDLPAGLLRTGRNALRKAAAEAVEDVSSDAMALEDVRAHLSTLPVEDLRRLCDAVIPPLQFSNTPPVSVLVSRLSRTVFAPGKSLDPEAFFWLRRWTREGGQYLERG
jgi:hypothetical protein